MACPRLSYFAKVAIAMFQITKNNKSAEYAARLAKLEQAIDEDNRKLLFISADTKAKNTLFNRISSLEASK